MSAAAPSRVEFAIVADDLTGAADSAAAFAVAGLRSLVLLKPQIDTSTLDASCDVIAISANSRDIGHAAAADAIAGAVRALATTSPRRWFKKIDSTLRGHLASELRVATELLDPELTVVCPAFPREGRVLREGLAYVHGTPLEQTRLWRDVGDGAAHLPTMLGRAGAVPRPVTVAELRSGKLAQSLQRAQRGAMLVVDAETDEDLETLVKLRAGSGTDVLWVGSAGLAGALAAGLDWPPPAASTDHVDQRGTARGCRAERAIQACGPVLVVAGSPAAETQRQLVYLERTGEAAVARLPAKQLLCRDPALRAATVAHLESVLITGQDAVLAIESTVTGVRCYNPGELASRLGERAGELASRFHGLVLTGGDTARAVLEVMRIESLTVVGQLERGIPLSHATGSRLLVVTKAGAFGDDRSLSRALRLLHGGMASTADDGHPGDETQ